VVSLIFTEGDWGFVPIAILVTLGFALIGFADDLIKVVLKRSLGLKAKYKLLGQISLAVIFAFYAYTHPDIGSTIVLPFAQIEWNLGIWYVPFVAFVVVATTNSVNLTDGLDGLAAGVSFVVAVTFVALASIFANAMEQGNQYNLVLGYEGMAVFSTALAGAILGFLKYNIHPAKVFMGDTGSMGLGGAIVAIAVLLRLPLLLPVMGGIYMLETLSVIIQVLYFKFTGRRIFKMSPLHHHFELCGMSESKVVASFTFATMILCLIGFFGVLASVY
jgi:phospho-N-acetylmuramoyl-pentapeptide-transferase